uniref:Ycf39 n=1 Tax=Schizocladia ischiensis TaxID=196139 RepID=A0A7S6UA30_9STRA|nr:Ycf39 [Schizocladia ischiensis]QOW07575.1 Ycf39 [Schizocladia ischiensis]
MTLLIIGGTGTLGRQIVRKALENGFHVRCIVRNKRAANFLQEWGAELVYGDLTLPETLPISFQGVTAIIDASTTKAEEETKLIEVDWYGKLILIELAKYVHIQHFIFLSILNAKEYPFISLMRMKAGIEDIIQNCGMPFTIFKCAGFFQALINQYAIPVLENKNIIVTKQSPKISYIDTQDAAKLCIKSLSIKETINKTFFLGSNLPWNSDQIIRVCELLSGQKAKTQVVPIFFLRLLRQITGFFEWSLKISERLAFLEVLNGRQEFFSSNNIIYDILDIDRNEIIELDSYLIEYFEMMLINLENLTGTKGINRDLLF